MFSYTIECEKCRGEVILEEELTLDFYSEELPFRVKETGDIIEDTINSYLIYRCTKCEQYFKYNYKDWERLYRIKLERVITEAKKRAAFKLLDPLEISQDGGIAFCGYCEGYDKEGNCLKDIIKRCDILKKAKRNES